MIERIATGLKRSSISLVSEWAENYRVMKEGTWSFKRYPWLKAMHNSDAVYNVGRKAAQMGYTETMLNISFHSIDVRGKDVLYVLPNKKPDATDFSTGRFDPAIELSPYLGNLFSSVDNIDHKRAGTANLFIRGSNSRKGLKSLPISVLIMDELAEFVEANIPLAFERVSGQLEKLIWMISTPLLPGFGISKYYEQSNKQLFNFPCPACGRHITLDFPESLIITGDDPLDPNVLKNSHLICKECHNTLEHSEKVNYLANGIWVPQVNNRDWNGFSISQLYSTTVTPGEIAVSYLNSLTNEADEMEFHNSKLGIEHETVGARVAMEDINECIIRGPKHQNKKLESAGIAVLGVDVGKYLHYEVNYPIFDKTINYLDFNNSIKVAVAEFGKLKDFNELAEVFQRYNISSCVIDAQPERRMALNFARNFPGRVKVCFFSRGATGKSIITNDDPQEPVISVDRSAWLDQSLGRFKNKSIFLPTDINLEYRNQIREPVRVIKKDEKGNPVSAYHTRDNADDHYAFSRTYAEIALSLLSNALAGGQDIT